MYVCVWVCIFQHFNTTAPSISCVHFLHTKNEKPFASCFTEIFLLFTISFDSRLDFNEFQSKSRRHTRSNLKYTIFIVYTHSIYIFGKCRWEGATMKKMAHAHQTKRNKSMYVKMTAKFMCTQTWYKCNSSAWQALCFTVMQSETPKHQTLANKHWLRWLFCLAISLCMH